MKATAGELQARNPCAIERIKQTEKIDFPQAPLIISLFCQALIEDWTYGKTFRLYGVV